MGIYDIDREIIDLFSASHVNYKAHSEEAPVAPGRGSQ